MTPKEAYPLDNRATAACTLLTMQDMLSSTLSGIQATPADIGTADEWEVAENELAKAQQHLTAATRVLLAIVVANK